MTHKTMRIKKLNNRAITPTQGSEYAAGYDLYSNNEEVIVVRGEGTAKIGTGLAMEIPEGYFGAIYARSGLATKQGLRPANCVGVVDSDYRGEVIVALHNDSNIERVISPNERIAQLVLLPYLNVDFIESDSLEDTDRNDGGFGSTGIN